MAEGLRKAICPVSISKRSAPNAKMSERWSTGAPRICSGDMYRTVPTTMPETVSRAAVSASSRPSKVTGACDSTSLARPKSRSFTLSVARQEDVLGLQVAVDDAGGVGGREALCDLDRGGGDDLDGERPAVEAVPERLALEELGDEVGDAVVAPDVEDGEDVRVVEPPDRLHLDLEPADPVGVGGPGPREDLDGDVAAEPGVPGAPDLAHPARTDAGYDFVGTELVSRRECHRTRNVIPPRRRQRTRRTVQKSQARSGCRR